MFDQNSVFYMWISIEIMDYAHKISQNNGKWNAPQRTERSAFEMLFCDSTK